MPTINNETVIGSGYVTYRNARPQLLSNGWIVVAVYSSSANRLQFRVKKTPDSAWEDLAFLTTTGVITWSLAVKGTRIFAFLHTSTSSATSFLNFDATTVSSSTTLSAVSIDNTPYAGSTVDEATLINSAGTELHHVFSAKMYSSYEEEPFYKSGSIQADGSVVWSVISRLEQILNNATGYTGGLTLSNDVAGNLVLVLSKRIVNNGTMRLFRRVSGSWGAGTDIFVSTPYEQSAPSSVYVPPSINGFANGRIWLAFHRYNVGIYNIWTSFSDDGGVTWTTPVEQTTGTAYTQRFPVLTAEKTGKVFLYWNGDENANGNTVTVTREKVYNGTWGTSTSLSGDNYKNVTALFDPSFNFAMSRAPIIRNSSTDVLFNGSYTVGVTIAPTPGSLGNKEVPNVLSYTVTPESGSTVTSIIEKVNGTMVNTYSNPASLSRTFTIPQSTWDNLKYWSTHTISVIATNSNGISSTQTYTFTKTLANDASLLEGTKAAKDGKDRISTKRDVLAGQLGLSAGSTFDAISVALDAGQAVVKRQSGTITSSSGTINGVYYVVIPFSSIGFIPKSVQVCLQSNGLPVCSTNTDSSFTASPQILTYNAVYSLDGTNWYTSATGVRIPIGNSNANTAMKWIAYG